MEIAVQDMPIIRKKKRPKNKDHRLQDNFFFFLKDKISSPRHAWKKEKQRKKTKKEMNTETNKKSISMTFTDPYISL